MDQGFVQTLALFIAGIIAPLLTQLVKGNRIQDRSAQWLAVVISYLLAFIVFVATGGMPSPDEFVAKGGAVTALAMIIYRQIMKPAVEGEPDVSED